MNGREGWDKAYIVPSDAETSGHSKSMSWFSLLSAKLCRSVSGSARKPISPAAEVKLVMLVTVLVELDS